MIKTKIGEVIPLEVVIIASNHNGNLEVGYRYVFEDEDDEIEKLTIDLSGIKANEAYINPDINKQLYDFLKVNGYLREVGYYTSLFYQLVRVVFTQKFFREVETC